MIRRPPSFFLAWMPAAFLYAQALDPPFSFQAQVGSNYFGQTLAVSSAHRVVPNLWGSLGLEMGSFNLRLGPGESVLWITNNSGTDYQAGLDLRWMASASLAFRLEEKGDLRFVNSFGAGLTFYEAGFRLSHLDPGVGELYQGAKDYSGFALLLELQLLEVHLPGDPLFFSLGARAYTAFLPSPQSIVTRTPSGLTRTLTLSTKDGSPIPFPYMELVLGIGHSLD